MTETISQIGQKNIDAKSLFLRFFESNCPFVFFKNPNSTAFNFLADSDVHFVSNYDEIFTKSGFVFAPFDDKKSSKNIIIENQIHYVFSCNDFENPKLILKDNAFEINKITNKKSQNLVSNNQLSYIEKVKIAQIEIEKGELKKVVLAEKKSYDTITEIDYVSLFKETCDIYPDAFVSIVYIPNEGIWLGASPEVLISVDKNQVFKTVALAGTKAVKTGDAACDAQWTQKEIQEQALVERYIVDCFKKIRLREYEEDGPKTVRAGSLWHLKSEFSVDLLTQKFEHLPQVMLKLLHPTSAVCGTPKDKALEIIKLTENFDREYYAGYLGAVNLSIDNHTETHIYVNLRCAKLFNNMAHIFIGAGITSDSVAEKEEKELAYKSEIILKVLNKILK
ncbi:MAG: isochorismate synthase [Bacteroidetes bacterium]|nr:MAG: isochorismate synthase [Bacteroidota bacterium]